VRERRESERKKSVIGRRKEKRGCDVHVIKIQDKLLLVNVCILSSRSQTLPFHRYASLCLKLYVFVQNLNNCNEMFIIPLASTAGKKNKKKKSKAGQQAQAPKEGAEAQKPNGGGGGAKKKKKRKRNKKKKKK